MKTLPASAFRLGDKVTDIHLAQTMFGTVSDANDESCAKYGHVLVYWSHEPYTRSCLGHIALVELIQLWPPHAHKQRLAELESNTNSGREPEFNAPVYAPGEVAQQTSGEEAPGVSGATRAAAGLSDSVEQLPPVDEALAGGAACESDPAPVGPTGHLEEALACLRRVVPEHCRFRFQGAFPTTAQLRTWDQDLRHTAEWLRMAANEIEAGEERKGRYFEIARANPWAVIYADRVFVLRPNRPVLVDFPACCKVSDNPTLAEQLYCAYNLAGAHPGLNFRGEPCPVWSDLPPDVRVKWEFVADMGLDLAAEARAETDAPPMMRRAKNEPETGSTHMWFVCWLLSPITKSIHSLVASFRHARWAATMEKKYGQSNGIYALTGPSGEITCFGNLRGASQYDLHVQKAKALALASLTPQPSPSETPSSTDPEPN